MIGYAMLEFSDSAVVVDLVEENSSRGILDLSLLVGLDSKAYLSRNGGLSHEDSLRVEVDIPFRNDQVDFNLKQVLRLALLLQLFIPRPSIPVHHACQEFELVESLGVGEAFEIQGAREERLLVAEDFELIPALEISKQERRAQDIKHKRPLLFLL